MEATVFCEHSQAEESMQGLEAAQYVSGRYRQYSCKGAGAAVSEEKKLAVQG
jgi:hypothetical protein